MNALVAGYLVLAAGVVLLALPTRSLRRRGFVAAGWIAALLSLIGGVRAMVGVAAIHAAPGPLAILPGFDFALTPLRGFFVAITACVYGFSVAFTAHDADHYTDGRARLVLAATAVLFAAMIAILLSAGVTSLLFTWEVMSLALAALVFMGHPSPQGRRAGMRTLALSEAGALAALAGLLVLAGAAGTWSLAGIATAVPRMPAGVVWAGFLLTFFGFGVKTGILPVNIWMGEGYAAAPRGALPLFSGAELNLGIFTLCMIDGPLALHAPAIGLVMLAVGAVTAILGIVYALATHSLTRLLTQSSIENLGIVVAALGAGFAFAALDQPVLGGVAVVAGLYHMLNHSTYKTLLFIGSGGLGEAASDDLNRLGGILRRLPLFGTLFLLGAFAIAALPPFNGFVSEWLVLQSLLRVVEFVSIPVRITFALSGALLALTAGLAVTCFAMLAASSLLGLPRSPEAAAVSRMPRCVTWPMGALVLACFALGVLATAVIPVLGGLAAPLVGTNATDALVPAFFGHVQVLAAGVVQALTALGAELGRGIVPLRGLVVLNTAGSATNIVYAMSTVTIFLVLALLLLVAWFVTRVLHRRRAVRRIPWDAGLPRLRPEMTYAATAYAAPVRVVFNRILRPAVAEHAERQGAFVTAVRRENVVVHIVDRLTLRPVMRIAAWIATHLARMHRGRVTAYAAYIVVALAVALLAAVASLG